MKISLKRKPKSSRLKKLKFLFFPLYYKEEIYWLEKVVIKKSFNGRKFLITDIIRIKDIVKKVIGESSNLENKGLNRNQNEILLKKVV